VRALSVTATLINRPMWQLLQEHGCLPGSSEQAEQWASRRPETGDERKRVSRSSGGGGEGAYSVIVGDPRRPDSDRTGHVVPVLFERVFLETTIRQAQRPAYQILPIACAVEVDPAFLAGEQLRWVEQPWGWLCYEALGADRDFMTAADWQNRKRIKPLVDHLVRVVREAAQ
jgi:hypothetical protein